MWRPLDGVQKQAGGDHLISSVQPTQQTTALFTDLYEDQKNKHFHQVDCKYFCHIELLQRFLNLYLFLVGRGLL